MAVAAPFPERQTQGRGRCQGVMASYPTSRTGFTALGSGFTGMASPGLECRRVLSAKTSPFDGLGSVLRVSLGGRFTLVDKSNLLAHFSDVAARPEPGDHCVIIARVFIQTVPELRDFSQF